MRTIKFRVRLKDTNTIHAVTELRYAGGSINEVGIFDPKHFKLYGSTVRYYNILDVDLMQYTGLQDKNGFDIYEGDIIEGYLANNFKDKQRTVIQYKSSGFHQNTYNVGSQTVGFNIDLTDYEIIGNVHEHPELIGGK